MIVVCPGNPRRAQQLLAWTEAQLREAGQEATGRLFAVTGVDPGTSDPYALFVTPCWRVPFQAEPTPLITLSP